MLLVRTNRRDPRSCLCDEIGRVFTGAFERMPFGSGGCREFPALNVWEDDRHVYVEAELPGLKMDDIEVFVQGDELTVKGQRPEAKEDGVSFHRRERGSGCFNRAVRLPVEVDEEKVEAALRNGVLTITLPKAQDVLPRKIQVQG